MATDFNETPGAARYNKKSGGSSIGQMWKSPIFKLAAVVIVGGGAAFAGKQYLSQPKSQEVSTISVTQAPINQTKNTEVTPEYQRAVAELDTSRADLARARGESAVPTPMQNPVAAPVVDAQVTPDSGSDPLKDFDNIISASRANNGGPARPQPQQQLQPAVSPEAVQALTKTMRSQMDQLMGQWTPPQMTVVRGSSRRSSTASSDGSYSGNNNSSNNTVDARVIVPAGTVYYGQMLMEANSDVPGPIMAQILTGPFAGGRAIGSFETYRDYLALRFKTVAIRNRQFSVDILALDPDTTLGGVATEVDPRYFTRVLLPAAAAFIKSYGQTISQPTSTTTVDSGSGSSVTTNNQNGNDSRDALYAGLGEAADRVGSFVDEEASATKRLVRVAVGTPIGLFFVSQVTDADQGK